MGIFSEWMGGRWEWGAGGTFMAACSGIQKTTNLYPIALTIRWVTRECVLLTPRHITPIWGRWNPRVSYKRTFVIVHWGKTFGISDTYCPGNNYELGISRGQFVGERILEIDKNKMSFLLLLLVHPLPSLYNGFHKSKKSRCPQTYL